MRRVLISDVPSRPGGGAWRQGDKETRRQGEARRGRLVPLSPCLLVPLSLLFLTQTARGALRDLQAHGSDDRLWLARAEPQAGTTGRAPTTLFVRAKADASWRRLAPIESPVLGLANRGPQLAILLANGDWLLMTDTSPASGLPLPDRAHMVALGSDAASLWAVGLTGVAGGAGPLVSAGTPVPPSSRRAATSPATTPTTTPATTSPSASDTPRPATGPSPGRLTLYRLGPQEWEAQGPLPQEIPGGEGVSVSLAVVGGVPVVAHKPDDRRVRVFRRADGGGWDVVGDVRPTGELQDYKVLQGTGGAVVWTRSVTGTSQLWIAPGAGGGGTAEPAEPVERELVPPGPDGQADHAVAFANGALRMLWIEDNKIFEQRLNAGTGAPDGEPAPLPLPAIDIQPAFQRWSQIVLMAALVFAMAASIRRRGEVQEASLDPAKIPLAPFSTRLAAGSIDALPALAAMWLTPVAPTHPAEIGVIITWLIGYGVYLGLTTLLEVLAGRSLGKMVTGLRVVGLDGKPAPVGARVIRNMLRVIDFPILPLSLIVFSPLRQRAGDFAAGTLVVAGKAAEEGAAAEAPGAAGTADGPTPAQGDESAAKPE
jgi:uncharacterized RDD family membrane protein YckC